MLLLLALLAELVLARSGLLFTDLRLTSGKKEGTSVQDVSKVGTTVPFVSFSIISVAKAFMPAEVSSIGHGTSKVSRRKRVSLVHILLIRLICSIWRKMVF